MYETCSEAKEGTCSEAKEGTCSSCQVKVEGDKDHNSGSRLGALGQVTEKVSNALPSSTRAQLRSITLLVANVIFVLCGSVAFQRIENRYAYADVMDKVNLLRDLKGFMRDYITDNEGNETYNYSVFMDAEWDKLKELHSQRCYKIDNKRTEAQLWNFWSSLDFCATVLTTIGYGNMYPKTGLGRFFTIFYSILGIPLMALYLAMFSKGIYRMISWSMRHFFIFLNLKVLAKCRSRPVNRAVTNIQFKTASTIFLLAILAAFVTGLSWILHKTNSHDSMVACTYFYVITLTTVGIGDISMAEHNAVVLVRVLLIFCVGLTLVAVVFSSIRNLMLENRRTIRQATSTLRSAAFLLGTYRKVRKVSHAWRRRISGAGPVTQRISQTFNLMIRRYSRGHLFMEEGLPAEVRIEEIEEEEEEEKEEDVVSGSSCGSKCHTTLRINGSWSPPGSV